LKQPRKEQRTKLMQNKRDIIPATKHKTEKVPKTEKKRRPQVEIWTTI